MPAPTLRLQDLQECPNRTPHHPFPSVTDLLVFQAVLPASTVNTVPVIFFALSLSRNSTALATSSTLTKRWSALRRTTCSRLCPLRLWVISVSIKPGATAFTLIARDPLSLARDLVKPTIDALVAL